MTGNWVGTGWSRVETLDLNNRLVGVLQTWSCALSLNLSLK